MKRATRLCHRVVVRLQGRLQLRQCRWPRRGLRRRTLRLRRRADGGPIDRAHRERLFEVGWRVVAERCREPLALIGRVAVRVPANGIATAILSAIGRSKNFVVAVHAASITAWSTP